MPGAARDVMGLTETEERREFGDTVASARRDRPGSVSCDSLRTTGNRDAVA